VGGRERELERERERDMGGRETHVGDKESETHNYR
jgi:hypothetical protein